MPVPSEFLAAAEALALAFVALAVVALAGTVVATFLMTAFLTLFTAAVGLMMGSI